MFQRPKQYELTSEFFEIPLNGNNDQVLIYFPIKSFIIKSNKQAIEFLNELKKGPVEPKNKNIHEFLHALEQAGLVNGMKDSDPGPFSADEPIPVSVTLLPTDRCNLNCLYCFNSSGTKGDDMSIETAHAAIDLLVANAIKTKAPAIDVGFHGGGESVLNWEVMQSSITYAKELSKKNNIKARFGICTNGIYKEAKMKEIAKDFDNILISTDGMPDLQNKLRPMYNGLPSFPILEKNIDLLTRLKKRYSFRITVTEFHAGRLDKDYEFLCKRFNPASIMLEPLHICGRAVTSLCQPLIPKMFIKEVIKCYDIAVKYNKPLQYSGSKLSSLTNRFCGTAGSNFFVTPEGNITSCIEVTSKNDPRAGTFFYGRYNSDTKRFEFDQEQFRKLSAMRVNSFESCKECFAKWHCGGDCLSKAPDMERIGNIRNPYRCFVNKNLTQYQLIKEFERRKVTVNS
jgi:uncharacterized protein